MPSIRQFPHSSLPFIIAQQSISPQFLNTNSESLVNKRWPELLEYLIPRIRQFVTKFIRQSPRITGNRWPLRYINTHLLAKRGGSNEWAKMNEKWSTPVAIMSRFPLFRPLKLFNGVSSTNRDN